MAIQALPTQTTRLIGSSQVLTTPVSLVKELLDNAIDARATSIDITISPNTVDKIEVRDNGRGIAIADLDALGRHGYTSKLASFEELRTLGGLTLGFRGEALASAVELADVSITTRTEGDAVAVFVKLRSSGGIASQSSASHPVGTTVSIADFLSKLPVRKQTALKDAPKNLAKIRDLLQSYALARLQVRLNLRVLKNSKGSWSFVPRPNGSFREAITQVIGRDIAAQCIEKSSNNTSKSETVRKVPNNEVLELHESPLTHHRRPDPTFIFRAFLPKQDADFSKVAGNYYVSIDARPVSCMRGTSKKIIAIYKSYIRNLVSEASSKIAKDPFIYLSITCPVGSYDPNIEPAKDDLLFDDDSYLLRSVEELFKSVYGEKTSPANSASRWAATPESGFKLLLAKKDSIPEASEFPQVKRFVTSDLNKVHQIALISPPRSTLGDPFVNVLFDGSHHLETLLEEGVDVSTSCDNEEESYQSFGPSNSLDVNMVRSSDEECEARNPLDPWLIAKLNAPIVRHSGFLSKMVRGGKFETGGEAVSPRFSLLTPRKSLESRPSSGVLHGKPHETPGLQKINDEDARQSTIDRWVSGQGFDGSDPPPQRSRHQNGFSGAPLKKISLESGHTLFNGAGNVSSGSLPLGSIRPIPITQESCSLTQAQRPSKPFVQPMKTAIQYNPAQPNPCVQRPASQFLHDNSPLRRSITSDDVEEAMDFERRKDFATRRRREELRALQRVSVDESTRSSSPATDHQRNILNITVAEVDDGQPVASEDLDAAKRAIDTHLADGDPRAYLMRRQKSISTYLGKGSNAPKTMRAKTMLLPFEVIPRHMEVHDLVCEIEVDLSNLQATLTALSGYDEYVRSGNQARGLNFGPPEVIIVEEKLNKLMDGWMRSSVDEPYSVDLK